MNDTLRIILASGSPRRRELLRLITEEYEVLPADVEETIDSVGRMAARGMHGTDLEILDIMLDK